LGFSALSGTRSASTSDPMASVSSGLSIGSADIVAGWGLPSSQAAETQRHPAERELKGEGIPGIPKYWSDLETAQVRPGDLEGKPIPRPWCLDALDRRAGATGRPQGPSVRPQKGCTYRIGTGSRVGKGLIK
jgi:hypothetical protein